MAGVALGLAHCIYTSGQYTADELDYPSAFVSGDENYQHVFLETDGGEWKVPGSLVYGGKNVEITLAAGKDRDGHAYAYVNADPDSRWGDMIIVALQRFENSPQHLMPLRPTLLPLWEGATRLVGLDPDDGGYMVDSL